MRELIELDSRKHLSLAKLGPTHTRYLATMNDDGSILLEPAVVLTQAEVDFAKSEVAALIAQEAQHPERFVDRPKRRS